MVDYGADVGGSDDDEEDDDIARFERQCAERAKAEGLTLVDDRYDEDVSDGDDEPNKQRANARLAAGVPGVGGGGGGGGGGDSAALRQKLTQLQEKLSRREAELSQARSDLDMVKADGGGIPGDVSGEMKQRLLELSKKNRKLQVTNESQKTRIQQLETELKKPREEAKKKAEQLDSERTAAMLGDGLEDWKQKYLTASNKLQDMRHEAQELRAQLQKHKKALQKELGSEEALNSALAVVDDPNASQWRGRAAQISQLQRQVRELKDQLKKGGGVAAADDGDAVESVPEGTPKKSRPSMAAAPAAEKNIAQAADKRRQEFERLQEEVERYRSEEGDFKKKGAALKSRNGVLEGQVRELKAHVQTLIQKSQNDDELVDALRRQAGRDGERGSSPNTPSPASGDIEALRRDKAELQAQLERQAQIVVQLRQKNIAAAVENGSTRLGPKSVEGGMDERSLVERVRYLEAENAKQSEQVRYYRGQLGDDGLAGGGRGHHGHRAPSPGMSNGSGEVWPRDGGAYDDFNAGEYGDGMSDQGY
eukprot:TRINITY_DN108_c0_g2_i3.p1 TRINITY_DN108_c0_g2~~TRINITY_DN108_c0_g2_i3.p1  ORF type:complete len:536 (+),score=213.17 TRINITY_DN108_c0_g2_i3:93-1700(+)